MYACYCDRCRKQISEIPQPGLLIEGYDECERGIRHMEDQHVHFDLCIDCYNVVHEAFMSAMGYRPEVKKNG